MLASNIISKLLPSANDEPPPFRSPNPLLRSSNELGPAMDIDEENLGERFQDQDLEHLLADAAASHITTESTPAGPQTPERGAAQPGTAAQGRQKWRRPTPTRASPLDDDNEVPESLLLEGVQEPEHPIWDEGLPPPVTGRANRRTRAQWEATRRQQRLHDDGISPAAATRWTLAMLSADPKERAMWQWVNMEDLDKFLAQVYTYYVNCGIWSTILRRVINLLQTAFTVGFLTFLTFCIDYSRIAQSKHMKEVLVPKCPKRMHGFWVLLLWLFVAYWIYSAWCLLSDIPRMWDMHNFYLYLLEIPDRNIQTVDWQHVVSRLMALRDANLATAQNLSLETRRILHDTTRQRMDAHDIANRLMRQENYLIALFNKEILDVTIPIPFLGNRHIFSQTTEWHVRLAVMDFVFDKRNQLNPVFLKDKNRSDLVNKLRSRFLATGFVSIVCAPFAVVFVFASYIFKYFTEYHKDPSQLSSRDFTPFAQWKFREFNELRHQFLRRRNMAYPFADRYLMQFPKDKMEQLAAFVAFVAGAFCAVLALFTIFDSNLFLDFEITPGKNALFYLGVLTVIYRVARSSSPQDDQVPDPTWYLSQVIQYTRYEPASWQGRLHSDDVRNEFTKLYQPKVIIFAEEILSMIITPFILIFRLPQCSTRIVDFFREFTIHVDGVGHVCSFAVFDFKKGGENAPINRAGRNEDADLREDYYPAKDNKMLTSYYGFLDNYAGPGRGNYAGRLQGRGQFHPPPAFPNAFGPTTPHAQSPDLGALPHTRGPTARMAGQRRSLRQSTAGRSSPIGSTLLDPHHQPALSAARSPRQAAQSRYQASLHHLPGAALAEDGPSRARPDVRSAIDDESAIGESWRASRLAHNDEDEDEDEDEDGDADRGGVLQLLHEFSKVQTQDVVLASVFDFFA